MTRFISIALMALVVTAVPEIASADIYRCVKRDGSVHFTNTSPARGERCSRLMRGPAKRPPRERRGNARRPRRVRRNAPAINGRYASAIRRAAERYDLPAELIQAIIYIESDFQPDVVSERGAMGLMQLMPDTAAAMDVEDPFNPTQNINGGARYLRVLSDRFQGDLVLVVAAYNAGPGVVEQYAGVPPYRETRRYVRSVLGNYYRLRTGAEMQRRQQ